MKRKVAVALWSALACSAMFLLSGCSWFMFAELDATISVKNHFPTDVTMLEYNTDTSSAIIASGAGAEDVIKVSAAKTGLYKLTFKTAGVGMITIDEIYTTPGGSTHVDLAPSNCITFP